MTRTAGNREFPVVQIETLAKALREQDAASRDGTVSPWDDLPETTKDVWRGEARKFQAAFIGVMAPEDG